MEREGTDQYMYEVEVLSRIEREGEGKRRDKVEKNGARSSFEDILSSEDESEKRQDFRGTSERVENGN